MHVTYTIYCWQEEIEHLLTNEQYVDGAEVELVKVG